MRTVVAEIAPFRALRYNLDRIGRIEDVVTPPYDVITPWEQELYHAISPYNIVRLEFGKRLPSDDGDNPAKRAGQLLRYWRQEGVLQRDPQEALYFCETDFELEGERRCRRGFIGLVRAEEFGGAVRRHELTFSGVRADRLRLIQECRANLSPVFGLYYDDRSERAVEALAARVTGSPELDFADREGCRHRLWRVSEPAALKEVADALKDSMIVVADGHHRYETAVLYAKQMRDRFPEAPVGAPFDYVMMYLCSSEAAGLSVLPAHRLLVPPAGFSAEDFDRKAQAYFELRHFSPEGEADGGLAKLLAALHANGDSARNSIGLYIGGRRGFRLLTLKAGVMSGPAGQDVPPPLRQLDVVVFGRIILRQLLGLPGDEQEGLIEYVSDTTRALEAAESSGRLAFLLNPTPVSQVQEVARHSLTMPRKSTYFYPKVMSGLTIHPLDYPPEAAG